MNFMRIQMRERYDKKTIEEIRKILKEHKDEMKKRYGVKEVGIFGSYVRGE
ncbi:MAG: nucleotidyltransferase family protein, partial [Candidatus Methanofastidiosia archaeon]